MYRAGDIQKKTIFYYCFNKEIIEILDVCINISFAINIMINNIKLNQKNLINISTFHYWMNLYKNQSTSVVYINQGSAGGGGMRDKSHNL